MASILKVDTLQKPDGSTPTAADLGIDVAGSVIQVQTVSKTDHQTFNVSTWTDASSLTINFTPKSANSNILVLVTLFLGQNGGNGSFWRVAKDGVATTVGTVAATQQTLGGMYTESGANAHYSWASPSNSFSEVSGSTATRTYTVQVKGWDSSQTVYLNRRGYSADISAVSTMTIYEIAQ
jgi:hypothetical protein